MPYKAAANLELSASTFTVRQRIINNAFIVWKPHLPKIENLRNMLQEGESGVEWEQANQSSLERYTTIGRDFGSKKATELVAYADDITEMGSEKYGPFYHQQRREYRSKYFTTLGYLRMSWDQAGMVLFMGKYRVPALNPPKKDVTGLTLKTCKN